VIVLTGRPKSRPGQKPLHPVNRDLW